MTSNEIVSVNCDADILIDDNYHSVSFNRTTEFEYENNYGSDADGNRGVRACFIVADRYDNVLINGNPVEYSERYVQDKINKALDQWLIDNKAEH